VELPLDILSLAETETSAFGISPTSFFVRHILYRDFGDLIGAQSKFELFPEQKSSVDAIRADVDDVYIIL